MVSVKMMYADVKFLRMVETIVIKRDLRKSHLLALIHI